MGKTPQSLVRYRGDGSDFDRAARAVIAAKRSPNTKDAYTRDLVRWLEYCRREEVSPELATIRDATKFRDHVEASLSKASARRAIASLSSIYKMLLRGRAVGANPFHPHVLSWPQSPALNKTSAVADEIAQAMIAHATGDASAAGARDAAILTVLYDTGLRRVSVAQLRRAGFRNGCIEAVVKGDKEVEIELPESSQKALETWLAVAPESPYIFPGKRGTINVATINKLVKQRALSVGVKHVHPHCFRASFITAGYDAGLPEHEIQASAHHANPTTTRRYDRGARGRTVATQISTFRRKKK